MSYLDFLLGDGLHLFVRVAAMEHRGIQYELKKGIGKDEWVWTIHPPRTSRQGTITGSRDRAVLAAIRAIDQWCYRHPNECEPPIP